MSGTDDEIKDGYTNAFWNLLEPFRTGKAIQGSLQYIGIEVLVGQLVRRAMNMKYNWAESAEIHTYSVPLIGQLNMGEPFGELNVSSKAKVELMDEATDGAKAIPSIPPQALRNNFRKQGLYRPSGGKDSFATPNCLSVFVVTEQCTGCTHCDQRNHEPTEGSY